MNLKFLITFSILAAVGLTKSAIANSDVAMQNASNCYCTPTQIPNEGRCNVDCYCLNDSTGKEDRWCSEQNLPASDPRCKISQPTATCVPGTTIPPPPVPTKCYVKGNVYCTDNLGGD
jgi:hypothetical protein